MNKNQHPGNQENDQENEQSVKVVDRRRFDDEGNDRDETSTTIAKQPKIRDEQAPSAASPKDIQDADISFSSFVMSLATQALMQLGEIDQNGMPVQVSNQNATNQNATNQNATNQNATNQNGTGQVNLAAAQEMIDILAMLQRKIKQGLDSAEEHLIEEILHNLRLSFIRRSASK